MLSPTAATLQERRPSPSLLTSGPRILLLRWASVLVLLAAAVFLIARTWNWPMIWDAQVFRYVNFLVAHGWQPYRDIIDMNLPGAYFADNFVVHTLGTSDLAWRVFDLLLLATITGACIVITKPYEWIAGLAAGVQFALFHALDGPYHEGQRDEMLAALAVLAYALLITSLRRGRPWLAAGFGACIAIATTIKPTALPLGVLVLLLALRSAWKQGQPWRKVLWWALAGAAVPSLLATGYLLHHHAVGPLLEITRRITPFYSKATKVPVGILIVAALPIRLWPVFGLGVVLLVRNMRQEPETSELRWERWAILIGVLLSGYSYYVQHKGYSYHRYPLLVFVLLAIALELGVLRRSNVRSAQIALVCLFVSILWVVPRTARSLTAVGGKTQDQFTPALRQDLRALGETRLQHQVQCLDLVNGCLMALYREGLVQNTGYVGDLLLFSRQDSPAVDYYRNDFRQHIESNPPAVIVESNEWYGEQASFDKIATWPWFAELLATHYHVYVTRQFTDDHRSAYRIYVLNSFPSS